VSQFAEQIKKSSGLLDAVQAVTNRKAFLILLLTFIVCGVLVIAVGALAGVFGPGIMAAITGFVGMLITAVVGMIGASAAGFILNAAVRNRDKPSVGAALSFAVATIHRQLGVLLLLAVFTLILVIVIALLLLICKIPGIGPVLYAFVFPLSALAAGLFFYGAMFVLGLIGPAIWEGNTIMRTVALLWAITRTRLISLIVQAILLGLLVMVVSGIVFGVVGFGMAFTASLSAPILSQGMGGMGMDMGGPFGAMAGLGNHAIAASIGMAVIFGCAFIIPVLVSLAGNCIIFANLTENLSSEEAERSIKGALDAAKEKADQVKRQLEESRQKQQAAAAAAQEAAAQPPAAQPPAAATPSCPYCQSGITPDDLFCGNCGHRLK